MCSEPPSPDSPGYESWVRQTALHAAATIAAQKAGSGGSASSAANFTMTLVERFEKYLNTGSTEPPRTSYY